MRSSWVKFYNSASENEREEIAKDSSEPVGLNGTTEAIEWLWNKKFVAVGDTIAFEAWPPSPDAGK